MTTDITIPPEVVEETRKAMLDCGIWASRDEIIAAIRAGLRAWPGMETVDWYHADKSIILPLPATENGDE